MIWLLKEALTVPREVRLLLLAAAAAMAVTLACGGGDGPEVSWSPFWDADEPYRGVHVDWARPLPTFQEMYADTDLVVVGRAVERAAVPTPSHSQFKVEVQRWIKGASEGSITVKARGGYYSDGRPYVFDGDVLLELGRTYILFLRLAEAGAYEHIGISRGIFDVTKGTVQVYDHPLTEDLAFLEGLTVDEFAAVVGEKAARP